MSCHMPRHPPPSILCVPAPGKLYALDVQRNGVSVHGSFLHLPLIFKPPRLVAFLARSPGHASITTLRPRRVAVYINEASTPEICCLHLLFSPSCAGPNPFRSGRPPRTAINKPTKDSKLFANYPVSELHTHRSKGSEARMVPPAVLFPPATSERNVRITMS